MSVRLTFAIVGLLLSTACGSNSSPTPTSPTPTPTPSPTTPTGPVSSVSVVSGATTMTTTAYSPNPITVARGTTVQWVNNDNTTHTSTANGGAWNSGPLAPGGQFSFTFQNAGSFPYHCTIHPNMVGTVNVQ